MEIREVTQYNEKVPFTGYGLWIIFELRYRKAHLIHPIHLTELMLSEYELVRASGNQLWPINTTGSSFNFDRWKKEFKSRVEFFVKHQRSFPVQTVARVIAELDGIEVREAIAWIGSFTEGSVGAKPAPMIFNKANREYGFRKDADISKLRGRPLEVVNIIKENGPASIYQITHLAKGKVDTISDLGRVVTYFVHKLTAQGILEVVA
jgi:hypothetical protein